jgi:hypothetical protein
MRRNEFNPDRLKQRALDRYERNRKKMDVADASLALQRELLALAGMVKLASWLEKRKIPLVIKKMTGGEYNDVDRVVSLSGRISREKQLIFLIHECGHVLVGKPKRDERFGMAEIKIGERCTFRHKLDVIEEEFEAWHRGKKLARRLNIEYDKVLLEQEKQSALVSYIKWANGEEGFNDGDYSDMREWPDKKKRRRGEQLPRWGIR